MMRLILIILIFIVSLPALFFYGLFLYSIFFPSLPMDYPLTVKFFMLTGVLAWGMLFYMAILWIKHRQIPKKFSASATLLAILGLIPFMIRLDAIIFLALPAFLFVIYLCHYSWSTPVTSKHV